jgi:thioredoxin-like negative regulator of GroEL
MLLLLCSISTFVNLAPQAAKAAKGMVTIAAVDADAHKELGAEYQIQGFPTLKWVYADGDKIK